MSIVIDTVTGVKSSTDEIGQSVRMELSAPLKSMTNISQSLRPDRVRCNRQSDVSIHSVFAISLNEIAAPAKSGFNNAVPATNNRNRSESTAAEFIGIKSIRSPL